MNEGGGRRGLPQCYSSHRLQLTRRPAHGGKASEIVAPATFTGWRSGGVKQNNRGHLLCISSQFFNKTDKTLPSLHACYCYCPAKSPTRSRVQAEGEPRTLR